MPTLVGVQKPLSKGEPPTKPLDEAAWTAWIAKNRAQERRKNAARLKAVKWVSAATLIATAGFGFYFTPYDSLVRFVLTLGAIIVMFHAIDLGHYTFATVFGTLALLYNPVMPVVSFSGVWQCALMITSAVLFVASLAWPKVRLAHYDYRSDFGVYPPPKRPSLSLIGVPSEAGRAEKSPLPVAGE